MKQFQKYLNLLLICGLLGALVMTWLAPWVISILFTPPVSFGTNCEPAAAWSMHKLVYSQLAGLVLGIVLGLVASRVAFKKKGPEV